LSSSALQATINAWDNPENASTVAYIYIYRERERETKRVIVIQWREDKYLLLRAPPPTAPKFRPWNLKSQTYQFWSEALQPKYNVHAIWLLKKVERLVLLL
jgi:hypothetical protein